MEVHNGGGDGGRSSLVPIWMSLINFGHRVAPRGREPDVGHVVEHRVRDGGPVEVGGRVPAVAGGLEELGQHADRVGPDEAGGLPRRGTVEEVGDPQVDRVADRGRDGAVLVRHGREA